MARLVLRNAAGIVATRDITLEAAPVGGGDPHPNPPFSTGGFTIQANTDVDLAWQQYASFWCDNKNGWKRRRFLIDGRGIFPNRNQVQPKIFGAQDFLLENFVVRYVASASAAEIGGNDDVHTEGIYGGAIRRGILRKGYFGYNEGNTANAVFFTWFPFSGVTPDDITFDRCRFDLAGLTGNNRTHWGGPIWNTFDGVGRNLKFIDCQVRVGAPGSGFGNGANQFPRSHGGTGQWTYGGSTTGGSGGGVLMVPQGAPWPAFPDGSQGPPVLYA